MFPCLSKMIHISADSEKPHIVGGIWMKYCSALWQNYLWVGRSSVNASACAAWTLRPILSIPVAIFLTSRCAECCANDASLTSFRAALTLRYYFWLKSKKALDAPCHLSHAAWHHFCVSQFDDQHLPRKDFPPSFAVTVCILSVLWCWVISTTQLWHRLIFLLAFHLLLSAMHCEEAFFLIWFLVWLCL